jgi:hypothetical protein
MAKPTYKRCNLTLDLSTIRKCKKLADEKGQSVSAMVRWLVCQAHEQARRVSDMQGVMRR